MHVNPRLWNPASSGQPRETKTGIHLQNSSYNMTESMKEQASTASTSHIRWESDIQMVGIPEILPGFVLLMADNFFHCAYVWTIKFKYFESCRYSKGKKFFLISMEQIFSATTVQIIDDVTMQIYIIKETSTFLLYMISLNLLKHKTTIGDSLLRLFFLPITTKSHADSTMDSLV